MKTKGILAFALAGAFMASFGALTSCEQTPDELEDAPVVTLERVSEELTSVTFRISATNAEKVAYLKQDNLSSVPSARAIVTAGTEVSASGSQDVTLEDCTPGEQYYVVAAAISESGKYSEVATLSLTAAGTDCTFTIEIVSELDEAVSYIVSPSDDQVSYLTSVLPASTYGEASDEKIFSDIIASISASAEAAGQSLSEYLAANANKGQKQIVFDNLTPETNYVVVAVGVDAEGVQSTPVARETAATIAEIPEMTFELSVTDITAYSAHFSVIPSDDNSRYVWIYANASNFPDVTYPSTPDGLSQEDANKIADKHIEGQKGYLDAGYGLSTGSQSYDLPLSSDTKFYLFAFAYEPGLGRQSDCKAIAFETLHGFAADEFDVDVTFKTITSTTISASVATKDEGMNGTYWGATAIPKAEYDKQDALDYVDKMIEDQVTMQVEAGNVNYTRADAVESLVSQYVMFLGPEETIDVMNLTPDTEYYLAIIPVTSGGEVTETVRTYEFATLSSSDQGPSCDIELVGMYNADKVAELGIFNNFTPQYENTYYIAALKVTKGEGAAKVQYASSMGGDFTDPDGNPEGYWTDDWYMNILQWTEIPQENFDENGVAYIFLLQVYYNVFTPVVGNQITTIAIAADDAGTWGESGRVFYYANDTSDAQLGDPNELKALVDKLNAAEMQ